MELQALRVLFFLVLTCQTKAVDQGGHGGHRVQDDYNYDPYHFEYKVEDDKEYLHFGQEEEADGKGNVHGNYHVQLPDGRLQSVDYHVDDYNGYIANVKYDGEAHHPSIGHHGSSLDGHHSSGNIGNLGHNSGDFGSSGHGSGHFGNSGHDSGHFGNSGYDSGHFGNSGQDSGHFGNSGQDSGHFGNSGQDSGHFDNSGHDSGHFGNSGHDSGHFGNSGHDSGRLGKAIIPEFHQNKKINPVTNSNHGLFENSGHDSGNFGTSQSKQASPFTFTSSRIGKAEPLKPEKINSFPPSTFFDKRPAPQQVRPSFVKPRTHAEHLPVEIQNQQNKCHESSQGVIQHTINQENIERNGQNNQRNEFQFRNAKNEVKSFQEIQEEIQSLRNTHKEVGGLQNTQRQVQNNQHVQHNVQKVQNVQREVLNINSGQISENIHQQASAEHANLQPQFRPRPIGVSSIRPVKFQQVNRQDRQQRGFPQRQSVFY